MGTLAVEINLQFGLVLDHLWLTQSVLAGWVFQVRAPNSSVPPCASQQVAGGRSGVILTIDPS